MPGSAVDYWGNNQLNPWTFAPMGGLPWVAGAPQLPGSGPSSAYGVSQQLLGVLQNQLGNYFSAQQAMDFAKQQQGTEINLANTAIRRRVADLVAAGINPLLAVGALGGGAATPNVSAAQPTLNASMQTATNAALARKQIEAIDAQIENTRADTDKKKAETTTEAQRPDLVKAEVERAINAAAQSAAEARVLREREAEVRANVDQINAATSRQEAEKALLESLKTLRDMDAKQMKIFLPYYEQLMSNLKRFQDYGGQVTPYTNEILKIISAVKGTPWFPSTSESSSNNTSVIYGPYR